jgi:hypothetical protein
MNGALIERLAIRGASTCEVSSRIVLLEIGAASAQRASRLGYPITSDFPFENGTADYGEPPPSENDDEPWTEAKNQRRCDLIDRKYAGGLTPAETNELAQLQAQMLRHSRRVAPLPIEAARRLYQKILADVNSSL